MASAELKCQPDANGGEHQGKCQGCPAGEGTGAGGQANAAAERKETEHEKDFGQHCLSFLGGFSFESIYEIVQHAVVIP
jgi:hypothetical protein